ncbi:MAG: hemerythrin domain-containing protein [Methylobacterium frigidaeris]
MRPVRTSNSEAATLSRQRGGPHRNGTTLDRCELDRVTERVRVMEVWHLISRDHANIAELIRDIPHALNGRGVIRSRERLLADLIDELHAHGAAIEASLLTPLAEADGRARDLAASLRDEHATVMHEIEGLARHRTAGWLDAFEDATFRLDQHLHRHNHDLIPLARARMSPAQAEEATTAFIRARTRALRGGRRRPTGSALAGGEVFLGASVAVAAIGLGLLAWRTGVLRGTGSSRPRFDAGDGGRAGGPGHARAHDLRRGQPRSDLAAAAAPAPRRTGEDLTSRQDALLDEAVEETFPASDPIAPHQITR